MSSLVFLGFSMLMFFIIFGVMFTLVPMILGQVWTTMGEDNMPIADPAWQETYNNTESRLQYIIPLIPTMGLMVVVIKILMISSVRGRD